jgi:signal transduction histidine kinase
MAVPVVSDGDVVGVLSVSRLRGEPDYTDDELSALVTFGDFMGVVTDVERQRAERDAMVEAAVRERLGQAVFDSVISDLLRATTGMYGVLAAVDARQRDQLARYVRAVDRAIVGFRGILAGEFAEPAADPPSEETTRSGSVAGSTTRFSGSYAPDGDWGWDDAGLLGEMDDYIAAILGDLYQVTTQLASTAALADPGERLLISQSVRQLDALAGRVRGAAGKVREAGTDQGRLGRVHGELSGTDSLRTDQIAMIGHDVRVPLGVVLGYLEILREQHLTEEQADVLDRAMRAARRTHDLLERILALAVADSGQFVTHPAPVDLDRWLPGFLQTVPHGDEVKVLGDPAHGAIVFDHSQLAQILSNLVSNAFRHGARPVTLTVWDLGSSTRIEVADAGTGIPASALDGLFERTALTTEPAPDGALDPGLGLYLSRRLAEANGAALIYDPGPAPHPGRFVLQIPHETFPLPHLAFE